MPFRVNNPGPCLGFAHGLDGFALIPHGETTHAALPESVLLELRADGVSAVRVPSMPEFPAPPLSKYFGDEVSARATGDTQPAPARRVTLLAQLLRWLGAR